MRTMDVAIIGAGPYGLSLAAHLSQTGLSFACFGEPMSSWRRWMPAGMLLRSEGHASNLWDPWRCFTLESFARENGIEYRASGLPVPLSVFLDYTDWFRSRAVPAVRETLVERLSRDGEGFELLLADGERVTARRVVVAAGHRAFRFVPPVLRDLPAELVSHACDHAGFASLAGKNVIVVGGGQSSLETAALLHEQGVPVRVLLRKPRVLWNPPVADGRSLLSRARFPESGLGFGWKRMVQSELPFMFRFLPTETRIAVGLQALGPSGAWWLSERILGRIPILAGHDIVLAREAGGEVQLTVRAGGKETELQAEHVIAATGYKPDVTKLPFLEPALREEISAVRGLPKLTQRFESSVPGLHFMGMLTVGTFGPVMRFMFGAKHAAPALARELTLALRPWRDAASDQFGAGGPAHTGASGTASSELPAQWPA